MSNSSPRRIALESVGTIASAHMTLVPAIRPEHERT